ncbi:phosphoesterase [Bacillus sp. AFS076308]|uniref:phosphoesterase n=1 Tax=unclassified Bacillus (in: firmicutes) TaxID=185979 RepID=UPI000BF65032|nr:MULTISPECIES: phosphoesterase [unclassified Bacillus (in: firmicutes)]PFO01245.1 phosphoesterase [Bacillus sp. AFS076308]PGV50074.1 phosphoesterase [Bacillus sp. AFS037270]
MKSRFKKKAIPLIATTVLATTSLTTQTIFNDGGNQNAKAQSLSKEEVKKNGASWLAGDHHVHSEWSVGWDNSTNPPTAIRGGDAIYPIVKNAENGKKYGLDWMMTTDHGGPNHSKVNLEQAYPELLKSREAVPEVLQFYGMELDTPGADHSTLMIPKGENESQVLYDLESKFNSREAYPNDPSRNTESKMIEALNYMKQMDELPISIAHHPSRSATGVGAWGQDTPQEFRNWNDTAPNISIGMEGAPGHQAGAINPDGSLDPKGSRGSYSNANAPTMGGFDQMSAIVGGLWDSMLGEGRHWWITATSDSHVNWRDGGSDFWPGEYSKTYVKAEKNYEDVMENLRKGNVFVTTGDLISELDVKVQAVGKSPLHAEAKGNTASIGETLTLPSKKSDVTVTVRIKDPNAANSHGDKANVQRVDLIMGEVNGKVEDRSTASNPTTKVVKRFTESDWKKDGEYITITYTLKDVEKDSYIRLRGTNTDQLEPVQDPKGENPWNDLWFYSNPIFIKSNK